MKYKNTASIVTPRTPGGATQAILWDYARVQKHGYRVLFLA